MTKLNFLFSFYNNPVMYSVIGQLFKSLFWTLPGYFVVFLYLSACICAQMYFFLSLCALVVLHPPQAVPRVSFTQRRSILIFTKENYLKLHLKITIIES